MYLARFSYDVPPVDRGRAIDFIQQEVTSASGKGLDVRLLVPLTRGEHAAALQFEVELTSLDQRGQFRQGGIESTERTGRWVHACSEILNRPPEADGSRGA